MADFELHAIHLPPRPSPEPGTIEGTLHPLLDGPGDYRVRIVEHGSGRVLADEVFHSPDGDSVAGTLDHREAPGLGEAEPFQRNVRIRIGDEPPRPPVPIWLRSEPT